jgi:hypothetical protein
MALILGEVYRGGFFPFRQEALEFSHGLLWDEHAQFVLESLNLHLALDQGETVPICSDHGNAVGFQQQQSSIQGVARFLAGDREDRPVNHCCTDLCREACQWMGHGWEHRKVVLGHPHQLERRPFAGHLDPMVLQTLKPDFSLWKRADNFQQPLRGNCSRSLFLDFSRAATTHSQVQVSGANAQR